MTPDLDSIVARRLRNRRRLLHLTQTEVATSLGVRLQTVSRYECAQTHLSLVRFVQLCETLSVAPADILGDLT